VSRSTYTVRFVADGAVRYGLSNDTVGQLWPALFETVEGFLCVGELAGASAVLLSGPCRFAGACRHRDGDRRPLPRHGYSEPGRRSAGHERALSDARAEALPRLRDPVGSGALSCPPRGAGGCSEREAGAGQGWPVRRGAQGFAGELGGAHRGGGGCLLSPRAGLSPRGQAGLRGPAVASGSPGRAVCGSAGS
jgi:hypothetical protein